ncbi:mitotic spindle assembly checkpoint protein MAD1-like isoform X2 [Corticium candelabrum]|uniref:mitotic spindle assembly checkpoint protein MAD1-like isoform X2 n=1 Tax=Corticium candelabrum TaxID=121492 RepID=UPI002E3743D7|nr:mitotic spindle assembly checkpoint protein MAD1-like isoform X2 [Corticium candelabrum]
MAGRGLEDEETTMHRAFQEFISNDRDFPTRRRSSIDMQFARSFAASTDDSSLLQTSAASTSSELFPAERLSYRAQIASLETKVDSVQREAKIRRFETQQLVEDEAAKVKQRDERIEELRRQRGLMCDRTNTLEEQLDEMKERMESGRRVYEERIRKLTLEKKDLKTKLDVAKETAQEKIIQMNELLTRQEHANAKLESKLKETSAQLDRKSRQTAAKLTELEGCEHRERQAVHKVKELESLVEQYRAKIKAVENSHSQLMKFSSLKQKCQNLEQENMGLRKLADNNAVLMEQNASVEAKLQRAEARLVNAAKLELENEELKRISKLWETCDTGGAVRVRTPQEMSRMLAELQQRHCVVVEEKGRLATRLKILESNLEAANQRLAKCEHEFVQEQEKSKKAAEALKKLERKVHFLKTDRDKIRNSLKSYETEIKQLKSDHRQEIQLARQDKEKLVELVKELEREIEAVRRQTPAESTAIDPQIEAAAMSKVMRFAGPGNPLEAVKSDHRQKLALLRKDNQQLRQQLQAALGGKQVPTGGVGGHYDIVELQEKLKNEQTKRERMEMMFQAKARDFRNAVYSLLGYRIDLRPDNQCRLTSIYAERDEDHLIFEVNDGGRCVAMKDTQFSAGLSELVETYLRKHKSVPALLASLTLDLVRNHTLIQL